MAGKTMDKCGISEARFIVEAFKREWEIAKPFHHAQGYDFVIRRNPRQRWETVQVKTVYADKTGRGKELRSISMRRCNEKGSKPYRQGDFDLLCAVDGEIVWLIPWKVVAEKTSVVCGSSKRYDRHVLEPIG